MLWLRIGTCSTYQQINRVFAGRPKYEPLPLFRASWVVARAITATRAREIFFFIVITRWTITVLCPKQGRPSDSILTFLEFGHGSFSFSLVLFVTSLQFSFLGSSLAVLVEDNDRAEYGSVKLFQFTRLILCTVGVTSRYIEVTFSVGKFLYEKAM